VFEGKISIDFIKQSTFKELGLMKKIQLKENEAARKLADAPLKVARKMEAKR
jgi:hypothetical protein